MRKIKFRFWDCERFRFPEYYEIETGKLFDTYRDAENNTPIEDVVAMQFIGLKDKNGVDIYEGDILSAFVWCGGHGGGREFKGVVVYKEAAFVLECKLKDAINPYILNFMNQRMSTKPETIFEVLGNIHEHPELCTT